MTVAESIFIAGDWPLEVNASRKKPTAWRVDFVFKMLGLCLRISDVPIVHRDSFETIAVYRLGFKCEQATILANGPTLSIF